MKSKSYFLPKTLITLLVCLLSLNVYPEEVDVNTAKRVAVNCFTERAEKKLTGIRITNVIEEKENGETIFYIITFSEKGFVLVAADDIVKPVLGYSFESNYAEDNHPPAFELYIIKRLKKQIFAAKQANLLPDRQTIHEWNRLTVNPESFQPKGAKSSVPLLTTIWGQGLYYNTLCPADPGDTISGHVPCGCVATAMAQVLNYWQHPWRGTGSHSYTPENHPEYGLQSANFENTYYNFDNMPDTVTNFSVDIETLIYHCAVSVDMNFSPEGSSAWWWGDVDVVSDALKSYFYFDDEADGIRRSSHLATWVDKMKENLDLNRPVIYGGYDNQENTGHAWVLDAYTTGDMFHCNWGWDGSDNGWFSIDDFTVGGYSFDVGETACVNMYPKTGSLSGTLTLTGSPYYLNFDHYVYPGDQLIIEPGVEVIFTGRYKLEVQGRLDATGTDTDSIIFTSELPEIGMRGIRFINTNNYSADSSKVVYCRLENGKGEDMDADPLNEIIKGGAIYCENSSKILIAHSEIKNSSAEYGGGIACYDTSNIRIKSCIITNDSSGMGGGLYLYHSDVYLSNNLIFENECFSNGGGMYCDHSNPTILHDTLGNNTAGYGGGIGFSGGDALLDNVIIHDNEAVVGSGGGIFSMESNLDLNNVELFENEAATNSGGIFCGYNSSIQIDGSLIHHNRAPECAAMLISYSNVELMHATIGNNLADAGEEGILVEEGMLTINNSILWSNPPNEIDTTGNCSISVSYSIIKNGDWTGTGVINDDPLFNFPYLYKYDLTWEEYPMPDVSKSPGIDSGDPSSPTDPDGSRADMGAIPFEEVYTAIAGGNISGTLTCAGSPYFVDGDLVIAAGDELIIEPCVYVMFRGDYKLGINGRLLAVGTETDKITFSCLDTITRWKGLRFNNLNSNGQDSSILYNCRISWGNADGNWGAEDGGGLYFNNSSTVRIENCSISKNDAEGFGGGICCYISSAPLLINNIITQNTALYGGAVYCRENVKISGGLFYDNRADRGGGIYIYWCEPELGGVTVRNNTATFGGGIYLTGDGIPTFNPVSRCNIYLNYAIARGLDFHANPNSNDVINLFADTLTVFNQFDYFTYPVGRFSFDFLNDTIQQIAQDLYMAENGSDDNSGTNPSEPLKTLHMALMKIMADSLNPRHIYLANGTYSAGTTGEIFPVNLRSYVSLSGTDIEDTEINGEDKNQLLYAYDDHGLTIENIHFTGGYAANGGAVYFTEGSSPFITNAKFSNNYAVVSGGGMYSYHSYPVLSNVIFTNNTSGNIGGAVRTRGGALQMTKVDLTSNVAFDGGGALYSNWHCEIFIDSCNIKNNSSRSGGGIFLDSCTPNSEISNTEISNNKAVQNIYWGNGGGVYCVDASPSFDKVDIINNEAYSGGGICGSGVCESILTNVNISGNTATKGGAVYLNNNGDQKYYNALIGNNTAEKGAGFYLNSSCDIEFINGTIGGNACISGNGGAVFNRANPVFLNSIIWDNYPDGFYISTGAVTANYCDIEDSWPGTGNIDTDPYFELNGYKLRSFSPCINAANPDTTGLYLPLTDLEGNPRIVHDTIDMGAYEYQFPGAGIQLELTVFLDGPFNGVDMNTGLNNTCLPLSQPYNTAPWNYDGTESVTAIPDVNIVDWVLIELRDAPSASLATPATTVAQQAVFLMNNGMVVATDGISAPLFFYTPVSQLFAVIRHRNHLAIMSAGPLSESGGVYYYDFTSGSGQAFNNGQKEITSGIWGMIAGDADASGVIDETDKSGSWQIQAGLKGYLSSDMNFDTEVNNRDKNDYWINNIGNSSQIPD